MTIKHEAVLRFKYFKFGKPQGEEGIQILEKNTQGFPMDFEKKTHRHRKKKKVA